MIHVANSVRPGTSMHHCIIVCTAFLNVKVIAEKGNKSFSQKVNVQILNKPRSPLSLDMLQMFVTLPAPPLSSLLLPLNVNAVAEAELAVNLVVLVPLTENMTIHSSPQKIYK
jgi:hypothetical protein